MKKKILLSKMSLIKEHKKIIPVLKKAGLKKEAKEQAKDLKKYEKA
jgi:hypothetical protein